MGSPIAWTHSNVVLSAHPTGPSVHGQIISGTPNSRSTHHFELPLPDPVNANTTSFGPPICLAISNHDTHLFAFFPPSHLNIRHTAAVKLEGGVSCVWERTNEINSWEILEFWRSERGNDVVAGQWLDNDRKWTLVRTSAEPARLLHLPPSGPRTLNTPTLLLVMQREEVQLHYQSPFRIPASRYYNHIRANLRNPSVAYQVDSQTQPAVVQSPGLGQRIVTRAAICPLFNESSIMIATHSTIYPLVSYDPLDGFTSHMSHPSAFEDFGNNGQNLSLDVCEVSFNLYSLQWSLTTTPLFSVQVSEVMPHFSASSPDMSQDHPQLSYLPTAIQSLHIAPRLVPKPSPNATTHDTNATPPAYAGEGCIIVAHIASVDSPPTFSHLETWTLTRNRSSPNTPSVSTTTLSPPRSSAADFDPQVWSIEPAAKRTLPGASSLCMLTDDLVPATLVLLNDHSSSPAEYLNAGRVEANAHDRAVITGIIRLQLNDLRDDTRLGQSPTPTRTTKSLNPYPSESTPTFMSCAPNQTSAAVRSGVYPWHTLSIVPLLPVLSFPKGPRGSLESSSSSPNVPVLAYLSALLALHVLNANDAADLVRFFWATRFTESDIATLVRGALDLLRPLERTQTIISEEVLGAHLAPVIGFLAGLYRAAPDPKVRRRSRTMLTLCELSACLHAFDETLGPQDAGPRHREAAVMWQLSVLAAWTIGLCEDIVRDALRYHASRKWETRPNKPPQEEELTCALLPFVLLHQPMNLLRRALAYVKQAQAQLETNTNKAGRNAVLLSAHRQLASMLDSSPLMLDSMISMARLLEENALRLLYENEETKRAVDDLLFTQVVPPALTEHLVNATSLIASHSALCDVGAKTQLLLPASNLLDVPLVVRAQTDILFAEKDVISKTPLTRAGTTSAALGFRHCVRCGSRAELRWLDRQTRVVGTTANGMYWCAFANQWEGMCVCGGNWVLSRPA